MLTLFIGSWLNLVTGVGFEVNVKHFQPPMPFLVPIAH